MKRILVVAALFLASSLAIAQPKDTAGDEKAVRQVLTDLYAALAKNDVAALDKFYASDYTLTNESGEITTKAPRLAAIKSGELKYESATFADADVRVYGNAAVATYHAMVKGQYKGKPVGGHLRATLTFVKNKGTWQVVAGQVTKIAE